MKTQIYIPSKWKREDGAKEELKGSISQEIDLLRCTLQELKDLNNKLAQINSEIRFFIANRKTYEADRD